MINKAHESLSTLSSFEFTPPDPRCMGCIWVVYAAGIVLSYYRLSEGPGDRFNQAQARYARSRCTHQSLVKSNPRTKFLPFTVKGRDTRPWFSPL